MPADRLGPHVVGQRVVVRRFVRGETGPSGGPAMTDVLGICESWADGQVVVRREKGDLVTVPTADIVSGKTVPPRPTRHTRLSPEEADRLAHPGWRPVEEDALGDWVLRASGGFSNRGNSVLAVGDPGMPLDEAVASVAEWYDARGLPPRAHAIDGGPFEEAGWTRYEPTRLMLASMARALRRALRQAQGPGSEHTTTLDAGWLATDERAARHGEDARIVLEGGEVTFATVRVDGVIARGRGVVHGDWLGVSSLWTAEEHRGRGLGTAILRDLLEWGAERGATTVYLQVVESNERAIVLYESCGFETHHAYAYYVDERRR